MVPGVFRPVLAKHTKSFNLVDTLSVGVDRIQRNFEPMQRQVESLRQTQISDAEAKLIFYSAFVDGKPDAPKSLLPDVHHLYFEPQYPEFSPRTMWSLSNAFTSAFKKLDPVPQIDGDCLKKLLCAVEYLAQINNRPLRVWEMRMVAASTTEYLEKITDTMIVPDFTPVD
jgi:hypothetical protein